MEVTPCSHYVLTCPQMPVGLHQIRSQVHLFSVVLHLSEFSMVNVFKDQI